MSYTHVQLMPTLQADYLGTCHHVLRVPKFLDIVS